MKRPLVGMAAALVLGEVIAQAGNSISMAVWICVTVCCGIMLRCTVMQKDVAIGLLPVCWGLGTILAIQAAKAPPLDGWVEECTEKCQVQGTVYWKEPSDDQWKVYIRETDVRLPSGQIVKNCRSLLLYMEEGETISVGSRIQVQGVIGSFSCASNPGQFDARQYYRAKKIDYPVFVSGKVLVLRESRNYAGIWLTKLRLALLQSLEQICRERDLGVFQAAFLGEKSAMDAEIKSLYQANGIAHILAISGLHISFLGNMLYQALRKITGSYKWSMAGGMIILASYGWMTGSAVSAVRAVVMFFCIMGAQTAGRSYDMLSAAGLSAVFVLVQYPLQLYEAGFLLTYGAILGIGGLMPCLEKILTPKSKIAKALLCSFSVQAVTLPVMLWFYYTYPVYSLVLNLFVIPFAGYLLFSALAGSIAGIWWTKGGIFFLGSGHYVLEYYEGLCRLVQKFPFARDVVGRPAVWQIFLYYGILLTALFLGNYFFAGEAQGQNIVQLSHKGKNQNREKDQNGKRAALGKAAKTAVSAVIFLVLYGMLHPFPDGMLHITMLDVDQGDCTCIQMPDGACILIDGGSTGARQPGIYRILPYLLSEGIGRLEQIVVTHPDEDHMNGICELLEEGTIQVGSLYLPDMGEKMEKFSALLALADSRKIPVVYAKKGDQWGWKNGRLWKKEYFPTEKNDTIPVLECLHPEEGYQGSDTNSYSIVLQLEYGLFSALFMGDAGTEQEEGLGTLRTVTLLKAGHHGSRYSSGVSFLEKTAPAAAVISCGAKNSYGHPHQETIDRLTEAGSRIFVTKDQGAVFVKTDGARFWVDTYMGKADADADFE